MLTNMTSATIQKAVKDICGEPTKHSVGDGFFVRRVFADKAFTSELSPFLVMDHAVPKEFSPTKERRGVGQHPHRGFETVTIAFQGEVEHADSAGYSDVIKPGDVQWMTAGAGIVHEEFHSTEFSNRGGILEMCQLWVNLPKSKKLTKAGYQPILAEDIPQVPLVVRASSNEETKTCTLEEGHARIIAGEFNGVKGPAKTFTPINLWVVSLLTKEKNFELDFEEGHTTLIFVRSGSIEVQGKPLRTSYVAIMDRAGTKLTLKATENNTSLLILSGEPIDEPIAHLGPFVMNTDEECNEAMLDYQRGINGLQHFKSN